jgi:hypothetical protein
MSGGRPRDLIGNPGRGEGRHAPPRAGRGRVRPVVRAGSAAGSSARADPPFLRVEHPRELRQPRGLPVSPDLRAFRGPRGWMRRSPPREGLRAQPDRRKTQVMRLCARAEPDGALLMWATRPSRVLGRRRRPGGAAGVSRGGRCGREGPRRGAPSGDALRSPLARTALPAGPVRRSCARMYAGPGGRRGPRLSESGDCRSGPT